MAGKLGTPRRSPGLDLLDVLTDRTIFDETTPQLDWTGELLASGCWLWQGAENGKGYGQVSWEGRTQKVHVLAYEAFNGPIPEGHEPDHRCRNTMCWHPAHLDAVTHRENMARSDSLARASARQLARSTCVNGHEFSEANTRITPEGWRRCRVCDRERAVEYRASRRG